MKVFVILVSLHLMAETGVSAENWLTERRERSELNANDVLAVAEVTGKFTDFHKLLDDNYNARNDDRHQLADDSWSCDSILKEDHEYGFEKYKEDVSESFLEMKRNLSQKNNMVLMKQLGKRKYPMFINTSVRFPFSLAKLRDKFNEEFPSYKNAVNYYDIASKAVLLVSIREGGKILKGITHEVTRNCAETGGDINLQTVRGLRSWLSAFKSTFDRLVGLMRTEKRINFADDPHRKAFDDRVDAMLTLIDVRDRSRTDDAESKVKICGGIPRQTDGTAYEAHVGDNEYKVLKFEDYYFLAPIRHIQQLYRFYAFDFL